MITIQLQGGLGNQMFQIAACYNFAKINNDFAEFNFDECETPNQGTNAIKYKNTIFKEFIENKNLKIDNFFTQKNYSFEKIEYKNNLKLIGFFQTEKFFIENNEEIKEKFLMGFKSETEKWNKVLEWISGFNNKKIVSVHIRRGDYLRFVGVHDICSLEYYKNALLIMKEKIGEFLPIFISDDKSWCLETFKDINCLISPFNDEIEDFILSLNCHSNIIANSSFSWWCAYLNDNKEKIIIAPKNWFGTFGPKDQQDIIPDNWIKI